MTQWSTGGFGTGPGAGSGWTGAGAFREDLSDVIYNVSPSETPVVSAIATVKASSINHDWPKDVLTPPDGTTQLAAEGAAMPTGVASDAISRLGNICAIHAIGVDVSGTVEAVDKAGRDSQMAYVTAKRLRELKTSVDKAIMGPDGASGAANKQGIIKSLSNSVYSSKRTSASLSTWIDSGGGTGAGQPRGTGGADNASHDGSALPTDGTGRAFTQAMLDASIAVTWMRSGRVPKLIVLGAKQKGVLSLFDGLGNAASASTMRTDRSEGIAYATIDVYMSNFGRLSVVPSRHVRKLTALTGVDTEIYLLEPEYLGLALLRPWQQFDLGVLGDSRQRELLVEWCLEVRSTDPHNGVFDLT